MPQVGRAAIVAIFAAIISATLHTISGRPAMIGLRVCITVAVECDEDEALSSIIRQLVSSCKTRRQLLHAADCLLDSCLIMPLMVQ